MENQDEESKLSQSSIGELPIIYEFNANGKSNHKNPKVIGIAVILTFIFVTIFTITMIWIYLNKI